MIKTYVIDTNVLIQAPYALYRFEENQVILPVVVLEELDHLKRRTGKRGPMPGRPSGFWKICARREICCREWP